MLGNVKREQEKGSSQLDKTLKLQVPIDLKYTENEDISNSVRCILVENGVKMIGESRKREK